MAIPTLSPEQLQAAREAATLEIASNRRVRGLGRHQVAGLKAEFK